MYPLRDPRLESGNWGNPYVLQGTRDVAHPSTKRRCALTNGPEALSRLHSKINPFSGCGGLARSVEYLRHRHIHFQRG